MKKLSEFIKESLNESKDYKSRDMAIEKLKSAGINVKGSGASAYAEIDGKEYAIKVHAQPLNNKCLIIDYEDIIKPKFDGFLFINPMTDYQDVFYIIPSKGLRAYIDSNISKDKKNGVWSTQASEKTIYGKNAGFIGVTMTIDGLKNNMPGFEEISLSGDKMKIKKYLADPKNRKKYEKSANKYHADVKIINILFDWLSDCVDTMKNTSELVGFLSDNDAAENFMDVMIDDHGYSFDEADAVETELFRAIADDIESL